MPKETTGRAMGRPTMRSSNPNQGNGPPGTGKRQRLRPSRRRSGVRVSLKPEMESWALAGTHAVGLCPLFRGARGAPARPCRVQGGGGMRIIADCECLLGAVRRPSTSLCSHNGRCVGMAQLTGSNVETVCARQPLTAIRQARRLSAVQAPCALARYLGLCRREPPKCRVAGRVVASKGACERATWLGRADTTQVKKGRSFRLAFCMPCLPPMPKSQPLPAPNVCPSQPRAP